jgi:hypothetical protein
LYKIAIFQDLEGGGAMKNAVLGILLSLLSSGVFAQSAPANSQNLLWRFSASPRAGQVSKVFCATSKVPPYAPTFCFAEVFRANMSAPPMAFVEYQAAVGSEKQVLKIIKSSPWKFLGRDQGYVSNADIYERQLTLQSVAGTTFVLTEVFGFKAEYDDYDKLRTREIYGILPNGVRISLKNIYMYN